MTNLEETKPLRELRRKIVNLFNLAELETLTYDIGVNWGELRGNGITNKVLSLITHLQRRNKLESLIILLQEERPDVKWRKIYNPSEKPIKSTAFVTSEVLTYQTYLDRLFALESNNKLNLNKENEEDIKILTTLTEQAFWRLKGSEVADIIRILHHKGLIYKSKPIIEFNNAHLRGISFEYDYLFQINLPNANLSSLALINCMLNEANLISANLRNVNLLHSGLQTANLQNVDLNNAKLFGTNLKLSNLSNAQITLAECRYAIFERARMVKANLSNSDMSYANFSGANLKESICHQVNFEEAKLCGANLHGASLEYSQFLSADLSTASFVKTNLHNTNLQQANLCDTDFSGANLHGANLNDAKNFQPSQLLAAKSLKNAIMPNGEKFEEWVKLTEIQTELQKMKTENMSNNYP